MWGEVSRSGWGGVERYKSQRERVWEKERERKEKRGEDKTLEYLMRECEKERESMQLVR